MKESERRLAETLIRKGTLDARKLEECLAGRRDGEGLLDTLVRQGTVSTAELESLLVELRPEAPPTSHPVPDAIRRLERYLVLGELGRGGMGRVFLAYDAKLKRSVALKVMPAEGEEDLARYRRELEIAASLQHPNIAVIYDGHSVDSWFVIAMQYIEGKTLSETPLSSRQALEAIASAARAVEYAHGKGVIHRDLKPENLMMTSDGRIYVLDFGIARSVKATVPLTQKGVLLGTPAYMSPEQSRAEALDFRTDVYSLGATLYAALTRRPPFDGSTVLEVLHRVDAEEPIPPRKLHPRLNRDVETIVLKAMRKDAAGRYASARELADDIGRFLEGDPILARPQSFFSRATSFFRRRPWAVAALGVLIAGVLSTAGLLWRDELRQQQGAEAKALLEDAERKVAEWDRTVDYPPQDLSASEAVLREAVVECDRAAEVSRAWKPDALAQKARALSRLGSADDAEAAMSDVLRLRPEGRFYLERARIRMRRLMAKAMETPRLSIAFRGWNPSGVIVLRNPLTDTRANLDPTLRQGIMDDLAKARGSRHKTDFEALLTEAVELVLKERFEDGERMIRDLAGRSSPWERSELHRMLSWVYYLWALVGNPETMESRLDLALREITLALGLKRSDADLYVFRAHVRAAQAAALWLRFDDLETLAERPLRWKEMIRDFEQLEPRNRTTVSSAREDVETALRIRPRDPALYVLLGSVWLMNYSFGQLAMLREYQPTEKGPGSGFEPYERQSRQARQIRADIFQPAEAAVAKALELKPDYAPGWTQLSFVHWLSAFLGDLEDGGTARIDGRIQQARRTCVRALDLGLDPSSEVSLRTLRLSSLQVRRYLGRGVSEEDRRDRIEDMNRIRELDPSLLATMDSLSLFRTPSDPDEGVLEGRDLLDNALFEDNARGWTLKGAAAVPPAAVLSGAGERMLPSSYVGRATASVPAGRRFQLSCGVRPESVPTRVSVVVLAYDREGAVLAAWKRSPRIAAGGSETIRMSGTVPLKAKRLEFWVVNHGASPIRVSAPRLVAEED